MNISYDFHMHSALSPCADKDMTPNNIINMALLNELDAIALTDHNSCKNCSAVMELGKRHNLIVIPGMELTTQEEIHIICLFDELKAAEAFSDFVETQLLKVKNKPELFGYQSVMDENDSITYTLEHLLIVTTNISVDDVPDLIKNYGGIAFPAHVDRNSYSIIASLGVFPDYLNFKCAEVSKTADITKLLQDSPILNQKLILHDSDAHRLEDAQFDFHSLNVNNKDINSIIKTLKLGNNH